MPVVPHSSPCLRVWTRSASFISSLRQSSSFRIIAHGVSGVSRYLPFRSSVYRVAPAPWRACEGVGYFAEYGDGGIDILPIATLYKQAVRTAIRTLARVLGVPEPILVKAPSAGLWAGQTDENELGMTYDQLDAALMALERGESNFSDSPIRERVRGMMQASEHKRQLISTCRRADTNLL